MSQSKDFQTFIYMYLKEHLVKPFSEVHYEWFDLLDEQKVLIVAPRGLAKSSVISFFYPLFLILEQKKEVVEKLCVAKDLYLILTKSVCLVRKK